MRSPRATCCLTTSYSSAVSGPGLRRTSSGMPILPTSWSRPRLDRLELGRRRADAAAEEDRVPGDVLGVALRVAVLACRPRSPAPGRRRSWCRAGSMGLRPATPDRVAAARLRLLEDGRRGRQELRDRPPSLGEPAQPTLTVTGRRSVASNWMADVGAAPRAGARRRLQVPTDAVRCDHQELVGPVAAHGHRRPGGRASDLRTTARTPSPAPWPWVSLSSRKLSMSIGRPRRSRPAGPARSAAARSRPARRG